jgi:hypothetical protein
MTETLVNGRRAFRVFVGNLPLTITSEKLRILGHVFGRIMAIDGPKTATRFPDAMIAWISFEVDCGRRPYVGVSKGVEDGRLAGGPDFQGWPARRT